MKGIRTFLSSFGYGNFTLTTYAWGYNVFFSALLYFCCLIFFNVVAGDTLVAEDISRIGLFNYLSDLSANYPEGVALLSGIAGFLIFLFLLVSFFVSAGIFSVLINDERVSLANLFNSSIQNFLKFFKMFLINIINWVIVAFLSGFLFFGLYKLQMSPVLERDLSDLLLYSWAALTLVLFVWAGAVYDFSRIYRLKTEKNCFYCYKSGLKFVFSNKFNVFFMIFLYILFVVFLYLLISILPGLGIGKSFRPWILLLTVYQISIWLRTYLKVVLIRSEISLVSFTY